MFPALIHGIPTPNSQLFVHFPDESFGFHTATPTVNINWSKVFPLPKMDHPLVVINEWVVRFSFSRRKAGFTHQSWEPSRTSCGHSHLTPNHTSPKEEHLDPNQALQNHKVSQPWRNSPNNEGQKLLSPAREQ